MVHWRGTKQKIGKGGVFQGETFETLQEDFGLPTKRGMKDWGVRRRNQSAFSAAAVGKRFGCSEEDLLVGVVWEWHWNAWRPAEGYCIGPKMMMDYVKEGAGTLLTGIFKSHYKVIPLRFDDIMNETQRDIKENVYVSVLHQSFWGDYGTLSRTGMWVEARFGDVSKVSSQSLVLGLLHVLNQKYGISCNFLSCLSSKEKRQKYVYTTAYWYPQSIQN